MGRVLRKSALRHGVATALLLVDVAAIGKVRGVHSHIGGHVIGRHVRSAGHALLTTGLRGKMLLGRLLRGLNLVAVVDTVLAALAGFRSVQTRLSHQSVIVRATACSWAVRIAAYLNQILAFGLSHERLELGCREGVDQACFGHNKQEHLSAGEDG